MPHWREPLGTPCNAPQLPVVRDTRASSDETLYEQPPDREITGQELSDLVAQKVEELRVLQIKSIKVNCNALIFNKVELDTLLKFFTTKIVGRPEIAKQILDLSGLTGAELEALGMKLARIGLHS